MNGDYSDIIGLPHHTSPKHRRMPPEARAAQFAPFAALTGFSDAIEETGRLTDPRGEPTEYSSFLLDQKQRQLLEMESAHPGVTVVYFVPDCKKSGGRYASVSGTLKRVDLYERAVHFTDGTVISMEDIVDISVDTICHSLP